MYIAWSWSIVIKGVTVVVLSDTTVAAVEAFLTTLQVWLRIHTHFFLTFPPLNHTQSVPVGFNLLLATMKEKTEIYNP